MIAGPGIRCAGPTLHPSMDTLHPIEPMQAPSFWQRVGEARVAAEPFRLLAATPALLRRRTDEPRTVIVVPGLGATDRSMAPLRSFLDRVGHRAEPWTLGRNTKNPQETLPRFVPVVADAIARHDAPVALVGWSLGGIVARESARLLNEERPGSVDLVVTFGTPVEGPRHTIAGRAYTPEELDEIDAVIAERRGTSIGCDVVAIHSRNDGVVGYLPVIDRDTPGVTNVEVSSSHMGMGIDKDVWVAVADALG